MIERSNKVKIKTMTFDEIELMGEEEFEKLFEVYDQVEIEGTDYIIEPSPTNKN